MRIEANKRNGYKYFREITTRWSDNDVYGHANNVIYYSWFDTVVNHFLIAHDLLDIDHGQLIGIVIESQCNYLASVAFPEPVCAGLRVGKLGNSSVRYEVGIFRGDDHVAAAQGHFVHVYVDRVTRRPAAIPGDMREILQTIQVA
ncbi:MAG: thioesterase family protein [Oxalobacteraceae bacterium]